MSALMNFFRKKHLYETQSDLQKLSAEEIARLDPSDIGTYIETDDGGSPLQGPKKRALSYLLALKRNNITDSVRRSKLVERFLKESGILPNPEVDKLIVDAHKEVLDKQINEKDLQNRLNALHDLSKTPYTREEETYNQIHGLTTRGGRKSKTGRRRRGAGNRRKSVRKSSRTTRSRKQSRRQLH